MRGKWTTKSVFTGKNENRALSYNVSRYASISAYKMVYSYMNKCEYTSSTSFYMHFPILDSEGSFYFDSVPMMVSHFRRFFPRFLFVYKKFKIHMHEHLFALFFRHLKFDFLVMQIKWFILSMQNAFDPCLRSIHVDFKAMYEFLLFCGLLINSSHINPNPENLWKRVKQTAY